jgi:hypothetical protein
MVTHSSYINVLLYQEEYHKAYDLWDANLLLNEKRNTLFQDKNPRVMEDGTKSWINTFNFHDLSEGEALLACAE